MGLKRFLGAVLAAAVILLQTPAARAVSTSASSAILMEASSGRVLYAHNGEEPRLIASVTKLMTALVALESGRDLEDVVTILEEDTRTEGSALYLKPGERVKLKTLLYGLLLNSGNDAALAVARFCGGSVEDFVAAMNRKAQELGMAQSHFANPSGLNAEGHFSSARDLAVLARACLDNETLAEMASTRSITLEGYTEKAGRTLVSAAEREGMTLIAVTLNDPNDWADHAALLDYGFSLCRMERAVQAGETVCTLPVSDSLIPFTEIAAGETLAWPLLDGETLETELLLDRTAVAAPAAKGERVGTLRGFVDGALVGEVPLVCARTAPRNAAEPQNPLQRLLGWILH